MTTSSLLQKLSAENNDDEEDPATNVTLENDATPSLKTPLIQELESKTEETSVAVAAEDYSYSKLSTEEKLLDPITEEECTPLLDEADEVLEDQGMISCYS